MGLAPDATRVGEKDMRDFGTPVLSNIAAEWLKEYKVLGEAYTLEISQGAALLGALSSEWQNVNCLTSGRWLDAFANRNTGVVQVEDPRLGPLPAGWRIASHDVQPLCE